MNVEDTTLIKRSSIEQHDQIQDKFNKLNEEDENQIQQLTDWCIGEGLSFGGSADLLIVTLFLFRIRKQYYFISQSIDILSVND